MIVTSIFCFAASVAALTLDVASSGGNQSSSLLYGLLYEVNRDSPITFFFRTKRERRLINDRISITLVMAVSMGRCSGIEPSKDPRPMELLV